MSPKPTSSYSGQRLRAQRERLHLSTREVESLSRQIAYDKKNQDYAVSHTWVTEVENGKFVPTLFKLYSLSVIYHRSLDELLGFFGITYHDLLNDQKCIPLPRTSLLGTIREEVIPR